MWVVSLGRDTCGHERLCLATFCEQRCEIRASFLVSDGKKKNSLSVLLFCGLQFY